MQQKRESESTILSYNVNFEVRKYDGTMNRGMGQWTKKMG